MTDGAPPAARPCSGCGRPIEGCELCDAPDCRTPICYGCMQVPWVRRSRSRTHWRGDVAVERERWHVLGGGRLHELAGQVGGAVDLEPVVGEGVVPHDDVAVAHRGHERAVVKAQEPRLGHGEQPHVMGRVEVVVTDHGNACSAAHSRARQGCPG
jgi:hypothetical protein